MLVIRHGLLVGRHRFLMKREVFRHLSRITGGPSQIFNENLGGHKFTNGLLSDSQFLTCGIPPGTILGPLLFLIYVNDLPNCLSSSKPRMYADDTHLNFASNCVDTINEALNRDLA